HIFVADLVVLFSTEYADFFSSASASSLHGRIRSLTFIVSHDCYLLYRIVRPVRTLVEWQFLVDSIRDIHKYVRGRAACPGSRCCGSASCRCAVAAAESGLTALACGFALRKLLILNHNLCGVNLLALTIDIAS